MDAMRGFTMLLVVFGHVMSHGLKEYLESSVVCAFFEQFRMPMFFFISGFIAYKASHEWNVALYKTMLKKKFKVQLIPTALFFLLYELTFNRDVVGDFLAYGTTYYWFCQVLFEMFLVYYTVQLLGRYTKPSWSVPVLLGMAVVVKWWAVTCHPDETWYNVLVGCRFCPYFFYFVLGLMAKQYQTGFLRLMKHDKAKACLAAGYVVLFFLYYHHDFPGGEWFDVMNSKLLIRVVGLLLVFALFYHYADFWDGESRVARTIRLVGRRTLDIYLIHYFFIPDLSVCADFILTNTRASVELAFGLGVAVWIIALSLAASAVIRISPWLGHFLFGTKRA